MASFDFLIFGLAVLRISLLFTRDTGPYGIFEKLRGRSELFSCVYCISVWISAGLFLLSKVDYNIAMDFSTIFALSGVALFLRAYSGVGQHD